jgi:hypothetical protein
VAVQRYAEVDVIHALAEWQESTGDHRKIERGHLRRCILGYRTAVNAARAAWRGVASEIGDHWRKAIPPQR